MEKFYVDQNGKYLGAFSGTTKRVYTQPPAVKDEETGEAGPLPEKILVSETYIEPQAPNGGLEVPNAPDHAAQTWNFDNNEWLPLSDQYLAVESLASLERTQNPYRILEEVLDNILNNTELSTHSAEWLRARKDARGNL